MRGVDPISARSMEMVWSPPAFLTVMVNFTSPWKAVTSLARSPVWTAPVTYLAESRGTAAPVWALVSDWP
ncbi:hypothetical protein D3C85_1314360 [compost metagenome]